MKSYAVSTAQVFYWRVNHSDEVAEFSGANTSILCLKDYQQFELVKNV